MKTSDIGVIFLHHRTDEVTHNNFESFERCAGPECTLISVSSAEPLPNGYSLSMWPRLNERWKDHTSRGDLIRRSADLLLYAWYLNRNENCRKWLIVEWDSYCAQPVTELASIAELHAVTAASVKRRWRHPHWFWFRRVKSLPEHLRKYATGIVPFSFIVVSDHALDAICKLIPWDHLGWANGELRFATLAAAAGFRPIRNRSISRRVRSRPREQGALISPGAWHPVKWLVPPNDP